MPIKEKELYLPTMRLLNEYGELTTTEIKNLLFKKFEEILDEEDLTPHKDRNDSKFSQTVRNQKSHYNENFLGRNGYVVFDDQTWILTKKGKKFLNEIGEVSLEKKLINETSSQNNEYTTRGITGKKAEDLFEEYYENKEFDFLNYEEKLKDHRLEGVGYDYAEGDKKIEIKGLVSDVGGILFTEKEWGKANEFLENYIVILFRNINNDPNYKVIFNPAQNLDPNKNINTIERVTYSIDSSQL